MTVEDVAAEIKRGENDSVEGMLVARRFPGIGVFRGNVVSFENKGNGKVKATALIGGERVETGLDQLAKARHLFFSERKLLMDNGFDIHSVSTVSNSLVQGSGIERPPNANDGVRMETNGPRAHENFELKDPKAFGVKMKPKEVRERGA